MATRDDIAELICERFAAAGHATARKMFGEYAVYIDGGVVALVCDNQLYVKPTDAGRALAPTAELAPPYPGAKDYLLIDERHWGNAAWMSKLASVTLHALPPPKPKKKRKPATRKRT